MGMKRSTSQIWDEYLVLNAQAGDKRAMRGLLANYQTAIQRHITRMINDDAEVQDVLQDTLITCCRQIHTLRDPASFRPWLYRIASNHCHDWQRKQYRNRQHTVDWSEQADEALETDTVKEEVGEVLSRLNPDDRSLLSLFYLEGFSLAELAQFMSISTGAVKTRLYRARACFQQAWERYS